MMAEHNKYHQVPAMTSHESLRHSDREILAGSLAAPQHSGRQHSSHWSSIILASTLLLATIGGIFVGTCMAPSNGQSDLLGRHEPEIQNCGETPAQARAKGCKYEVMLQMWIPGACYDEEYSQAFLSKYHWTWYYDNKAEDEMSDEVMRLGEHEVAFMVDDYHRRHCAYSWEITARALRDQKPLLDELLSFKHVHHCNEYMLSPPWNSTKNPIAVETHSGYGRCAPYSTWLQGQNMPA